MIVSVRRSILFPLSILTSVLVVLETLLDFLGLGLNSDVLIFIRESECPLGLTTLTERLLFPRFNDSFSFLLDLSN